MNKALVLLIIICCSCSKPEIVGELGNWEWFKIIGKSGSNSIISQYVDENDNIYLLINFSGDKIELDQKTFETEGSSNFLVAKLSSDGELIWVEKFGASGSVKSLDLAFNNNDLFAVGEISRNYVDSEPGTISKKGWILETKDKIPFILKLDSNGNTDWIKTIPEESKSTFNSITITESNRIFITKDYSGEDNFPILLFKGESAEPDGSTNSGIIEIDDEGNLIEILEFEGSYLGYKSKIISNGDSVLYVSHGLTCFNQVEVQRGREKCLMQYGVGDDQISIDKENNTVFSLQKLIINDKSSGFKKGFVKIEKGVNIYDIFLNDSVGILTVGSKKTHESKEGDMEVSFSMIDGSGNLIWRTNSTGSKANNFGNSITRIGDKIISTGSFIPPLNLPGFEFKSKNPDDQFQPSSFFFAVLDSVGRIENVIRNYPLTSSYGTSITEFGDGVLISGKIAGRTRFESFQTNVVNGSNSFIGKYKIKN